MCVTVSRFYLVSCLNKKNQVTIPDAVLETTTILTIIENATVWNDKIEQPKWEEEWKRNMNWSIWKNKEEFFWMRGCFCSHVRGVLGSGMEEILWM